MSRYDPGNKVRATKEHGGWIRERIDEGTYGVVTRGGWGRRAVVDWRKEGFWISTQSVEQEADDDELNDA